MKILREAIYSPDDIFVDEETGKKYRWIGGVFAEISDGQKGDSYLDGDDSGGKNGKQGGKRGRKSGKGSQQGETQERKPGIGDRPEEDDEILKKEREEREKNDVTKETAEDRAARLKKIKDLLDDRELGKKAEDEAINKVRQSSREKKKREEERKLQRFRKGIGGFRLSLISFIRDQIQRERIDSYRKLNKAYNSNTGSSIVRPGHGEREIRKIPSLRVYFDRSSSWDAEQTAAAKKVIDSLNDYVRKKQLTIDIRYFNDGERAFENDSPSGQGWGGTSGHPIINDIKEFRPNNVVVVTDGDIRDIEESVTVPGGVWFVWKEGIKSANLRKHLRGEKRTEEFEIWPGDK